MRLPKTSVLNVLQSLFVIVAILFCVCETRIDVHLHAMIPHHFSWAEDFRRVLFSKLLTFRRDRRYTSLFRTFRAHTNVTFLKRDSPREILNTFCDQVFPSNTTAILHINNPLSIRRRTAASQYVLELADFFGIPVISWDAEYSGSAHAKQESRTLQLAPTIHHQTQAMLKLLKRYNWTEFGIVTTSVAGHHDFIASLRSLVEKTQRIPQYTSSGLKPVRFRILEEVTLRNLTNKTQSIKQLGKLYTSNCRVFLLHSNSLQSKYIMDYAEEIGITSADYMWVLSQTSIPTARYAPRSFHLGLLGVSYDHSKDAMETAIKAGVTVWMTGLLNMAHQRRVLSKYNIQPKISCKQSGKIYWKDGFQMYSFMKNISVRGPPSIQFNETGTLKFAELKIINLQRRGAGKKWIEVGRWTKQGLIMQDITWPGEASGPPRGKPEKHFLRIATLKEEPYIHYEEPFESEKCGGSSVPCRIYDRDEKKNRLSNTTRNICCNGLSIDLLKTMSEQLEFDFDLFEVEDGQWGARDEQGRWNGLIQVLLDQKADMVLSSLKITPERNSAVDFSVPFLETGITIIVSIREGAISPTAFLEPYDYPSWCLILVFSVHATGASIFIFEWLSPYGLNQGKTTLREHRFSLFRSFWLIWAMLFSAAVSTDTPRGVSSRFLANLWALFAVVFLASYTANLAAFMITKEEYYKLSGIQDWRLKNPHAMKPPFKYATIPNGSTDTNIRNNHKDIYRYMKKFNLPTVAEGIKALKQQKIHAFIYDATVLEYYAGKDEDCRLITVGNWYAMTGYGVAFPRGSVWMNKINKLILNQQEAGEMERLQKFWLAGACDTKKEKKGVSSHTLGILNFTSAFILLAGGMVLGAILLSCEHCYFRFGRKSLKKWDTCGCCALVSLSMGKSLTFERSVLQAIEVHNRNKCRDPFCETQLWKIKHELDLALFKIDNLQNQMGKETDIEDGNSHWRYNPERRRQPNGILGKNFSDRGGSSDRDRGPDDISLRRADRDTRTDGGGTPLGRAHFRRSPSYTTAVSESDNNDVGDLRNRVRYHDGKYYFGVDDGNEMESIF